MLTVAQLVELQIVILVVVSSILIRQPNNEIKNGSIRSILRNVVLEESDLDLLDWSYYCSLGTATRISMITEKVKVVELTLEDGTKILCRGGEEAVARAWSTYPVISARQTGEVEIMQWASEEEK